MAAFEIRDLSFTYPDETAPALRHIRMDIPEGKITLICGASGSGKSTLLEAIAVACGFNPEGGTRNFRFATRETHSELGGT